MPDICVIGLEYITIVAIFFTAYDIVKRRPLLSWAQMPLLWFSAVLILALATVRPDYHPIGRLVSFIM